MQGNRLGLKRSVSRRTFLRGVGAAALATAASPTIWIRPAVLAADAPEQLHLQFGADASSEVCVISLNNDEVCIQDGGDTYVRAAANAIPNARFIGMPGLGHDLPPAVAIELIDHVAAFHTAL